MYIDKQPCKSAQVLTLEAIFYFCHFIANESLNMSVLSYYTLVSKN